MPFKPADHDGQQIGHRDSDEKRPARVDQLFPGKTVKIYQQEQHKASQNQVPYSFPVCTDHPVQPPLPVFS
jgi:hypothetical protein